MKTDYIEVYGAREHNLKDITVKIPRNELVVVTGLSGSGKSSLAFDTLYAEGQRRYIETFSAYARQFLGGLERPDVDKIDGLSPVIAIEQKTTNRNPRSTVGTITEIYDFLRLLYARVGEAVSYNTGEPMVSYSESQIQDLIQKDFNGKKILLLAPLVRSRKGHYRELFHVVGKKGYVQVRVDGELQDIKVGMKLDRYKTHDIEVVIDKLKITGEESEKRLSESINKAMHEGNGILMVLDVESNTPRFFSKDLMCPSTGISYNLPEPNTFSFNSPKGACKNCNGIGEIKELDVDKLIPDPKLSIVKGAIAPLDLIKSKTRITKQIKQILEKNEELETTPFQALKAKTKDELLQGINERVEVQLKFADVTKTYAIDFEGIIPYVEQIINDKLNPKSRSFSRRFAVSTKCPVCKGTRMRKASMFFHVAGKSIGEVASLDLIDFKKFIQQLPKKWTKRQLKIGEEIQKEILQRTDFLMNVGLEYLTLNRSSKTLSGGEAQRIRLATQIGSQLVNVLYILDEPSIGLHQRDNMRLIDSLKALRDIGNSVLVVEHDQEMIECADYVLDLGPAAGKKGGEIVWQGVPSEINKAKSLTAEYINGNKAIATPKERRPLTDSFLEILGATGNNLNNVDLKIPLQVLTVISGVSGSGKSSLVNGTLYRILNQHFFNAIEEPLPYQTVRGLEHLDKVIEVNQSPIGRTPRSNPATYTGVFSEIRNIFTKLPESKIRGYKPGRFSFNVKGGRCETCQGAGLKVIEMNFLPDIQVHCETCHGKRFNRETLEIRYKGKSIADVLEMNIDEAVSFFEPIPKIYRKIKMLQDVGLGYITLGQQSTTLSGGEAQRVKLATELSKRQTGKTLYILDEPTTGLHFEDIRVLMDVIQKLVDLGNSVIIIEHNLDVIKLADHLIDLGPEGGRGGGHIVASGTPEEVCNHAESHTAKYLKTLLL